MAGIESRNARVDSRFIEKKGKRSKIDDDDGGDDDDDDDAAETQQGRDGEKADGRFANSGGKIPMILPKQEDDTQRREGEEGGNFKDQHMVSRRMHERG